MRPTVTLFVPDGYVDADDFLRDCQFERAPDSERPSTDAMVNLISAIIQDEAQYDPATNTWDTAKAASSIVTALDAA